MSVPIPAAGQVREMPTDEILQRLAVLIAELDTRSKGIGASALKELKAQKERLNHPSPPV